MSDLEWIGRCQAYLSDLIEYNTSCERVETVPERPLVERLGYLTGTQSKPYFRRRACDISHNRPKARSTVRSTDFSRPLVGMSF